MSPIDWVSLHHHSTYSYLDGFGTPLQHAERAAELGYTALALTEHGNVSSHFRFEQAALKAGIKPIYGLEAYTGPVDMENRGQHKWHLSVLAEDLEGYRNLNALVTQSYKDFHHYPTVSGESLLAHKDGLIILSGCTGSQLATDLVGGKGRPDRLHSPDLPTAAKTARRYWDLLGYGHYFLEVQAFPELDKTRVINPCYEAISEELGIPLVATMDCHYPMPDDNDMQLILHATGRGSETFEGQARKWNYDVLLTLPDSDDAIIRKLRATGLSKSAAVSAVENAAMIGDSCNVTLPKAERLRYPGVEDTNETLWQWLRDGWRYRHVSDRPQREREWYLERIEYEMKLFLGKDLSDYLLVISDVTRWAKDAGIAVGPGRGSAAASVIAWLLRITEVDPIRHPGMLFERFLDFTRADPPDIDLDFEDERRHEIRKYLEWKYGPECVGTIANFVRYRGKNALHDVARVYRVPKQALHTVTNLVIERSGGDSRFDATLEDTIGMFPAAQSVFDSFPDLWQATRLEGNVRGMNVHAAGLVIANSPLTDVCAVYEREQAKTKAKIGVLSIDKYDAEYCGMLKMDFLGLTTMGMIALCLRWAGLTLEDLYAVPDTDAETLEVFRLGDVTGIFQFEGRATRLVNRDVHPDNFQEVADINALSRPGPLFSGTTAEYCDVKHGRREPERYHEIVDKITARTKGQIIYQEQILQTVREVGGFDWTHASLIRRIIAKKEGQAAFQVSMGTFCEGAERLHGIDRETAERIWKRLVTSGTYAFVNAHSVSYSILAWWCAWLKVHYPAEFYAASLAKSGQDKDAAFKLMKDATAHGLVISPPQLNYSKASWSIAKGSMSDIIVAGWESVPGFARTTADRIEADQERNGPFINWQDLSRIPGIGDKKVEAAEGFSLMKDPFGLDRAERMITRVRSAILSGSLAVPLPTYDGTALAALGADVEASGAPKRGARKTGRGTPVVWIGIVRNRLYQNAVENERSRTGEEVEDILEAMRRPDLQDYCVLQCYDDSDEEVYVRCNRFTFPKFKPQLEEISPGADIIIVRGRKSPGFGTSIILDELFVIDPT